MILLFTVLPSPLCCAQLPELQMLHSQRSVKLPSMDDDTALSTAGTWAPSTYVLNIISNPCCAVCSPTLRPEQGMRTAEAVHSINTFQGQQQGFLKLLSLCLLCNHTSPWTEKTSVCHAEASSPLCQGQRCDNFLLHPRPLGDPLAILRKHKHNLQ